MHECVTLLIKNVDLTSRTISVRNSKGSKYRTTVLPEQLCAPLRQQMLRVAALHRDDLAHGAGWAPMPDVLARKYCSASAFFPWQFVFPSTALRPRHDSGRQVRWHADSTVQRALGAVADEMARKSPSPDNYQIHCHSPIATTHGNRVLLQRDVYKRDKNVTNSAVICVHLRLRAGLHTLKIT